MNFTRVISIAIASFIPWIITLAGLSAAMGLSRPLFIAIHYFLDIALFAIAFAMYFKGHPGEDPFTVMAIAMVCLFVFELAFFAFFYDGDYWFLSYVDWIIPAFLIASTIYWIGKIMR